MDFITLSETLDDFFCLLITNIHIPFQVEDK